MKHTITVLTVLIASAAPAALVSERWGPPGSECTHPGTLKVVRDGTLLRLVFDLAALPKGSKVRHASLYCWTRQNRQPVNPAMVIAGEKLAKTDSPYLSVEPLRLEPPWYRSFDATKAVKFWAGSPRRNGGFRVELDGVVPQKSYLEIRYEAPGGGKPAKVPAQVTGLKVVHHDGQTFLVWRELKDFRPEAKDVVYVDKFGGRGIEVVREPGTGFGGLPRVPAITLKTLRHLQGMELRDKESGFQGIRPAKRIRKVPEVRYRIYRHTARITAANIKDAEWVGIGHPLSAYDKKMAIISFKGEYIDQKEVGGSIIPVGCVEDGKPVGAGEAVYVHNPDKAGKFYYAVTSVLAGTENASQFSPRNSLAEPVTEKLDPHKPVLQRLQGKERWYMFWAGPPYANLPNKPYHILVDKPPSLKAPFPLVIDAVHGGFNIAGAMRGGSRGAMTLMIENQIGYSGGGNLLYNEGLGTLRSFRRSKCDYFSERYFLRIIRWCLKTWEVDRARVIGGQKDSGPLHIGVRHPEIFKQLFMGNYTVSYDYRWAPASRGLPTVLGPRDLAKTTDGHNAWDVLNLGWYLRRNRGRDIPIITGGSNVGKDSGHTSEFGWQDDPRGWAALMETRQPFTISWGINSADSGGNMAFGSYQSEINKFFAARAWNTTYPAFSNCSLDDNPGNGDPADGCFCGQINGYLIWEDAGGVDEKDRWEMTVRVTGACPEDACTVDVTPRHCRKFKPRKGQKFKWTNTTPNGGKVVQSGTAVADQWGLVTVPKLRIDKAKHRISIRRK